MIELKMVPAAHPGGFVVLPEGLFRLANAEAVIPGRVHLVRHDPDDQFAAIVAVGIGIPQAERRKPSTHMTEDIPP